MSIPQPLRVTFSVTNSNMLQHSKTLRVNFIEEQPSFVTRDADFATPYETAWNTAINTAESHPTDEMVDDMMTAKTADVKAAMTNCRNKWMDTKPFIKKAFPNNTTLWNKFGFNNYQDIDASHEGMVNFFKLLHVTAVENSAALIAANYTQPMIDEIATLGAALDTVNIAQEKFKTDIPVYTKQRVEKHNAVYTISQAVCETGKNIFRNDYSKYQKFLLPASDESPAAFILKGKVVLGNAVPLQPIEDVIVTVQELPLNTQTDSNGYYGFGSLPAGTYTVRFHKVGFNDLYEGGVIITDIDHPVTKNATLQPL